jgi:hypothetical protein
VSSVTSRRLEPWDAFAYEVRAAMYAVLLIEKLKEIERSLEFGDSMSLRKMLADAQYYAVQLQRETPEQMRRDSRFVPRHQEISEVDQNQ